MKKVFTKEIHISYSQLVYSAQTNTTRIIDSSKIHLRIHFLVGRNFKDVVKAIAYYYCGSIP